MRGLIGYTGFVGSNLVKQTEFDKVYNSKNIHEIRGEQFDLLICAGVSAVKWKANKEPGADWDAIQSLINELKHVKSKQVVLISTVDVYKSPIAIDEETAIDPKHLDPYGKHRYLLENFVNSNFDKVHTVRLPGLFGAGLKKNIIYDFINNNAVDAIHSQNIFQFYNLERLYSDIKIVVKHNLSLVNFATEPVSVQEIALQAFGREFTNESSKVPVRYDMHSKYARLFNGDTQDYYFMSKKEQLEQIKTFVKGEV